MLLLLLLLLLSNQSSITVTSLRNQSPATLQQPPSSPSPPPPHYRPPPPPPPPPKNRSRKKQENVGSENLQMFVGANQADLSPFVLSRMQFRFPVSVVCLYCWTNCAICHCFASDMVSCLALWGELMPVKHIIPARRSAL